jgi:hypothetical protein
MRKQQQEQIERLFGALVAGRFSEFFAGCTDDLLIEFRGSTPSPTKLTKSDIPDWYGSLQALSPTSLQSSVEIGRIEGDTATVILSHSFGRNGIDYCLEMINLLEFRDGLLAKWSAYPLDLSEYARAWRTHELAALSA